MRRVAPGVNVYLACQPVDLRRGFDGPSADVARVLAADCRRGSATDGGATGLAARRDRLAPHARAGADGPPADRLSARSRHKNMVIPRDRDCTGRSKALDMAMSPLARMSGSVRGAQERSSAPTRHRLAASGKRGFHEVERAHCRTWRDKNELRARHSIPGALSARPLAGLVRACRHSQNEALRAGCGQRPRRQGSVARPGKFSTSRARHVAPLIPSPPAARHGRQNPCASPR